MFREGPIPAFVHGFLEYVLGGLLIAAPFLLTYDSNAATAVSIVGGVVLLALAAFTDMTTGLAKVVPVAAHVVFDYILALALIASPFLFGFTDDGTATAAFLVIGVVYLLMTIATRFVREPSARQARKARKAEPQEEVEAGPAPATAEEEREARRREREARRAAEERR